MKNYIGKHDLNNLKQLLRLGRCTHSQMGFEARAQAPLERHLIREYGQL